MPPWDFSGVVRGFQRLGRGAGRWPGDLSNRLAGLKGLAWGSSEPGRGFSGSARGSFESGRGFGTGPGVFVPAGEFSGSAWVPSEPGRGFRGRPGASGLGPGVFVPAGEFSGSLPGVLRAGPGIFGVGLGGLSCRLRSLLDRFRGPSEPGQASSGRPGGSFEPARGASGLAWGRGLRDSSGVFGIGPGVLRTGPGFVPGSGLFQTGSGGPPNRPGGLRDRLWGLSNRAGGVECGSVGAEVGPGVPGCLARREWYFLLA